MNAEITRLAELLQMTDSAFPVGTFSFSNGLETAGYERLVTDASTLAQYAEAVSRQGAFTDGVAAMEARRAAAADDFERLLFIDSCLMMSKLNDEARLMLQRMGKKLAELSVKLMPESELMQRWLDAVNEGCTPGAYPVVQGIAAALRGLSEEQLFASHQYGVVNMVLSAALRCVRVSHYDTQAILQELGCRLPALYEAASALTIEQIHCFAPEMDILASLHEKGTMRMFMN